MSNEQTEPVTRGPFDFADLLARQAQLRAWIDQLDAGAEDVPAHVADRVRADYESRLADLVDRLRAHEAAIRSDASRLQDELQGAREERELAQDGLAEGRLRNRLGEWSAEEWESRRTELERVVAGAAAREEELRGELERLEELLFEMDGGAGENTQPDGDDFGFLRGIDRAMTTEEETLSSGEDTGFDAGFDPATLSMDDDEESASGTMPLESAAFPVGGTLPLGQEPPGPDPMTRPSSGVKCPDCGYTNDATAWYCGVCGVNLT